MVAKAADTVSVGPNSLKRRVVNVAEGTDLNDGVNLAQLQAATAAPAAANLQLEVGALHALVQRLEARIARLESERLASARAEK